MRAAGLALLALLAVAVVPAASADVAQETALAQRYAPVVRLVSDIGDCGPGDPYLPIDVNVLFGEPTVALRGAWGGGDLVKIGPTAEDLSKGLFQYHLDFPATRSIPAATTWSGKAGWSGRGRRASTPTWPRIPRTPASSRCSTGSSTSSTTGTTCTRATGR